MITENTPFFAIEDLRFWTGVPPKTLIVSEEEFSEKLEDYIANLQAEIEEEDTQEESFSENLLESTTSPVIQKLNSIILKAVKTKVSDIHFEPFSEKIIVRFRLDGVLHEIDNLPKNIYPQLVSRIKVMAKLNVAEKRLPQDGRIKVKIGNKLLDLRVSTLPTVFGERIVIRILDKSTQILTLKELGFFEEDLAKYEKIIKKPYGLILITGPTGSGKSTTLYASLLRLKTPFKNIITIEDPVEYQIDGIGQIQVNPKINLTFASGLRSILRQDPDIIMVGEIRDLETARIALHASMTGHLVLSTLHTNDAPSATARLIDMGLEPFLIASSLEAVIAQRLVRTICNNCKTFRKPTPWEVKEISKILDVDESSIKEKTVCEGTGCEECLGTGFKGRTVIYEIMEVDDDIRSMISKNTETLKLKEKLREKGMKTLIQIGAEKALKGITTIEEILQVTQEV